VETLFNDDCFNVFKDIPENSVDMVCVDPPYGTTMIEWDTVLDFNLMWEELGRIVKDQGNIIIFGSQPFTSLVVCSKMNWFRHELIWNKNKCGSPGLSKYRPQKIHENILVFSQKSGGTYNPIMEKGEPYKRESKDPEGYGTGRNSHQYGFKEKFMGGENHGTRYPKSILHASRNFSAQQTVHPTQKPTSVLNWLLMTYSNKGDIVMDFSMGSGSCGVSAKMTGRNFIGVEKEEEYFKIAESRINSAKEDCVNENDSQLTTQISKDMKTTPDAIYEKGKLENIRNGEFDDPPESESFSRLFEIS